LSKGILVRGERASIPFNGMLNPKETTKSTIGEDLGVTAVAI